MPPVCVRCAEPVQEYGLCADCFTRVVPITDPRCAGCGLPFQNRMQGRYCGICLKSPPPCISYSAVVYDDTSRDIILSLKYGDNTRVVPYIGRVMLSTLPHEIRSAVDIIVPVPLHRRRLWSRKYNQSALLAQYIKRHLHIPLCTQAVVRRQFKSPQGGKSIAARYRNVTTAFAIKNPNLITDKTVLLIDDVYTSGATLQAVSKVLLQAGAKHIYALTYARSVHD